MPDGAAAGFGAPATVVTIDDEGGVTISTPAIHGAGRDAGKFEENLALRDGIDLAGIANEVIEGVDMDLMSRSGFVANYERGLDLLGLEIKDDRNDKTSKIGHPLMLEAVVRAQASAGAELMPAGGPCKVVELGGSTAERDALASAFESDFNNYLTTGAPEYYPDLDRGLFSMFYSGNMFRKVYQHPLRGRPVGETVGITDMIVSEDATDLETAIRVTHRSEMSDGMVRRMMRFADWRDLDLAQAQSNTDPAKMAEARISGFTNMTLRPQDIPREIYETTVDLDMTEYGMRDRNTPDLPVSFVVTIDKTTREILALRRGWREGDPHYQRRQRFVHYGMVPSFNFLCLGFVHLLGNQTQALRGIWRLLVTSGMYANAPGGLRAGGGRVGNPNVRPGPGEWPDIDIGGFDDIRKALMPMPYKDVSAPFMQLAESIGNDAMRMAGQANLEVGEGRANVPVGTMMSMIETATQTMAAIHKRLHRAQARELMLLRDCFKDNPEALWKLSPAPANKWREAAEFEDYHLVPASDPNVPSQIHRIQLATALVTVAGQNPDLYDRIAVHKRAWSTIGVADADSFILSQPAPPPPAAGGAAPPDPAIGQARVMEANAKIAKVQQDQVDMQRKAAEAALEDQHRMARLASEQQAQASELASRERIAQGAERIEELRLQIEQSRLSAQHARELHGKALDAAVTHHATTTDAELRRHEADTAAKSATDVAETQAKAARAKARTTPKKK